MIRGLLDVLFIFNLQTLVAAELLGSHQIWVLLLTKSHKCVQFFELDKALLLNTVPDPLSFLLFIINNLLNGKVLLDPILKVRFLLPMNTF